MLWVLILDEEQEINDDEQLFSDRTARTQTTTDLSVSCLVNGLLTIVTQLLNGQSLSFGHLFPLPLSHFSNLALSNS